MVGKDLIESHGEELRQLGSPGKAPGGEVAKVAALGERKRVTETERHSHRRHGVVVPGRVADEHAMRAPVRDARPQLIRRGVEVAWPAALRRTQTRENPATSRHRIPTGSRSGPGVSSGPAERRR